MRGPIGVAQDCDWKPWTWGSCIVEKVEAFLSGAVERLIELIFEPILRMITDAVGDIMATLGTFWIDFETAGITTNPDCDGSNPYPCGRPSDTVDFINDQLMPVTIAVATMSILIAAMRMAWTFRGEPVRELLRSLLTLVVVSSAGVSVIALLTSAGDAFSESIIDAALDNGNFGQRMTSFLVLSAASPGMLGLMIVLGIMAILASLLQIVLLIVRSGMLVLLVGVFPLAAAFTNTEVGRAWFRRIITWITAFLLYKPVAALIYATSIMMVAGRGAPWEVQGLDDLGRQIVQGVTGLMMMFLALFALPALMRLVTPLVAATAGGRGFGELTGGLMGKAAQKLADSSSSTGGGGGDDDGPSGSRNVGQGSRSTGPSGAHPTPSRPPRRTPSRPSAPSSGPAAPQASAPAPASSPAPAPAAASAGVGPGGGGAAGGAAAGGGAAAAAGPAAVAVVAIQAAKKIVKATKEAAHEATAQGADDRAMDEGPSGSG